MIKHFILSGLTFQMMMDVALYFKKYAGKIDVNRVWSTISGLHYDRLFNCILWIMIQYCGFSTADFPGVYSEMPRQVAAILDDLEKGGWMGYANKAVREDGWKEYNRQILMKNKSKVQYWLYMLRWNMGLYVKALFPAKQAIAVRYPYIVKYPILLPYAWLHRLIFRGSKAVKKGALTKHIVLDEQNTSATGKERVRMFESLNMLD